MTLDNLKITDFGLATLFRHHGIERRLETCCGTMPYVAPEVIKKSYMAQPVDVWSCGVVLVAMLAGGELVSYTFDAHLLPTIKILFLFALRAFVRVLELPWDEPQCTCREYNSWKQCKITVSPWNKIDTLALCK